MDAEIVGSAVEADRFDGFYRDWFPSVVRATALLVRDVDLAQEVAQEAFSRVWHRWPTLASEDYARNLVFRIAVNESRSHLRRWRRLRAIGQRSREVLAPDAGVSATDRVAVFRALASLSTRQRECIVLVDYLGYDAASAAATLGMRPSTVRVQLARGRLRLRQQLGEEEG